MDMREVAQRLGVTKKTAYKLTWTDGLPAVRVGGQWRVDEQDLEAWLREHRGAGRG